MLGSGPPPVGALEGDEGRELDGAPLAKADLARRALAVAVDRLLLPIDRLGRGDRRRRGDRQHHQRSEHPLCILVRLCSTERCKMRSSTAARSCLPPRDHVGKPKSPKMDAVATENLMFFQARPLNTQGPTVDIFSRRNQGEKLQQWGVRVPRRRPLLVQRGRSRLQVSLEAPRRP